jgi:hypothetical protein
MHLHPDLQQHLANFLVHITSKYNVQMLIATHSTTLLSSLGYYGGEKTSVIYLNNSQDSQKAQRFNSTLQEISTCLGGHVLMGPLFGASILLVEGDDDYKIWSFIPRCNTVKLAVIPCRGADQVINYQKTLEKLFSSIREDKSIIGYALLDGDKNLPNVPQDNIKFIKLNCKESENLYLTNEVLKSLNPELDWEKAKAMIKSKANGYGEKQSTLEQCDSWDRKENSFKRIINELSYILDEKPIPWTIRVAQCIGKQKPEGQLAEFLGNDVIDLFPNSDSNAHH